MSVNLNSTVDELDCYFFYIEVSESVKQVTNAFNNNPKLPGVILLENDKLVGLLSRSSYFQYMSRPYSLEIAAKRPIKSLLNLMNVQNFIIHKDTLIIEAAKQSLRRSPALMNEPIMVLAAPERYGIIDAHELLVYHAQIHEYTCELLTQMYGKLDVANRKLEKANRKLEHLSRVDDLTQVANRRVFKKYLQREWERGKQQKMPLAVIIGGIDYFSEYNNQYGALAGDYCLQNIAETISKCTEEKENLVARYDGSSFAIAMPNTDAIEAAHLAEKIRKKVKELNIEYSQSKISDRITLSIGVASMLPRENNLPKNLIQGASTALDRAKQQGKNRKIICNNSEVIIDDRPVANLAV